MSEFPHDQFAKEYLTELLSTIGKATPNELVQSERREGDIWFERDRTLSIAEQKKRLGLMGQLLTHDSLIEIFRNPATEFEFRSCKGKLFAIEGRLVREAARRDEKVVVETLPHLWLIMPTASQEIRQGFCAHKSRIPGVYRLPKLDRVGLIVIHQLAITPDTLWLRLLGKNGNQNRAIQELVTASSPSPLYANIEDVLADYRTNLESSQSLTEEEEELIMNLSATYLKRKEEWAEEVQTKIAINLLREGSTSEFIARTTGLSIESIEKLRDDQRSVGDHRI
jgi:transposase